MQSGTAGYHLNLLNISEPRVDSFTQENVVTTVCNEDRYHYGYNGQMKVNEWAGVGNHTTTLFREYDSRIGRWLSMDPLMKKNPGWSPYVFAFDNPIRFYDLEGNIPPTLADIINKGKQSATFVSLIKADNINDGNYANIIKPSTYSFTDPDSKTIGLKIRDENTSVLSLTHELSNLSKN